MQHENLFTWETADTDTWTKGHNSPRARNRFNLIFRTVQVKWTEGLWIYLVNIYAKSLPLKLPQFPVWRVLRWRSVCWWLPAPSAAARSAGDSSPGAAPGCPSSSASGCSFAARKSDTHNSRLHAASNQIRDTSLHNAKLEPT